MLALGLKTYVSTQSPTTTTHQAQHTTTDNQKQLKGRILTHWRMIPPLIAAAAAIAAVVYCLMMGHFYLTILFSAGLLGSLYALYLAHQYKHLKTFGENNEKFEESITDLQSKLTQAEDTINQLKTTAKGLNDSLKKALNVSESLRINLSTLTTTNEQLKSRIENLDNINLEIAEQRDQYKLLHEKHVEELQELSITFGTIQAQAFEQSTNLKFEVSSFKKVVENLNTTQTTLDANVGQASKIVDDVKNQMIELLKKQAEFVGAVTNNEEFAAFSTEVRKLEVEASERRIQLALAASQIEHHKQILGELKNQAEEQREINEKLKATADRITRNMQRLSAHSQNIATSADRIDAASNAISAKNASRNAPFKPYNSVPTDHTVKETKLKRDPFKEPPSIKEEKEKAAI